MPTVLLVEDNPSLQRTLCALLAPLGYVVTVAATVAGARLLAGVKYDAVLLDSQLSNGSGHELASLWPDANVVTMSGDGESDLNKPFTAVDLVRKLRNS